MDEEILIVITRMCFREAITCARAGIVWTRRGGDLDLGIQQDWNKNLNHLEMIRRQVRNTALDIFYMTGQTGHSTTGQDRFKLTTQNF